MEELTIRENLEYPARLAARLDERRPLIDRVVESLGLLALENRYPNETSVGEQQRAALARALVLAPQLLVADEPSGHQDFGWSNRVFEALRRATEDGTACVAATHDEGVAGYLDRVLGMSDGRLEEKTAYKLVLSVHLGCDIKKKAECRFEAKATLFWGVFP